MKKQFLAQCLVFAVNCIWLVSACGPGRGGGRRRMMRRYPPLVQRQYVPNVSEQTLGASGRAEGAIRRSDKRFKELVENWNPNIEFKNTAGNNADRIMSQRLKEKLNILAVGVMNQWPNVKLRVIEGYDERGQHDVNSLHREARAVDITTSDKDREKYGLLARLAVEAGFDWVHYEARSFVHCSVRSERSEAIRNGCFDAKSIVQTPQGQMQMSELQINQLVLTMNPKNGQLTFSPLLMWIDIDESGEKLFVELNTKSNKTIKLTTDHLIHVADSDDVQLPSATPTYAKNLYVGQYLLVSPLNNSSSAKFDKIVNITYSTQTGVYAPLTREGNIVVNSVVASCYAVISDHDLAHLAFAPVRWYSYLPILPSTTTTTTNTTTTTTTTSTSRQERPARPARGVHWYPTILYNLGKTILSTGYLY